MGKVIHWELCKKFKFDYTNKYAQPKIRPGEWDAQTFLGFWDTNGSHNLGQMTRFGDSKKKKKKKKKKEKELAE